MNSQLLNVAVKRYDRANTTTTTRASDESARKLRDDARSRPETRDARASEEASESSLAGARGNLINASAREKRRGGVAAPPRNSEGGDVGKQAGRSHRDRNDGKLQRRLES